MTTGPPKPHMTIRSPRLRVPLARITYGGHTPRTCRGRVVDVSACSRGTPKDMSRTCRGRVVGVSAPRPVYEGHVGGRAEPLDHLDLEHGALHHRRPPVGTCPGRVPDVSRRPPRHFAIGVHMIRSTNIFCVMPTRFIRMSATPSPVCADVGTREMYLKPVMSQEPMRSNEERVGARRPHEGGALARVLVAVVELRVEALQRGGEGGG